MAAQTSSAAAASGTSKASAGKSASPPGLTHVIAYSINTDDPVLTSVVSGAIGDYGPAEEVSPGSTGVSANGGELELKLTRGTFRLNIADIDKKFLEGTSHEPVFPRTCSTYVSVSDAVPIVPGSGTGAYRGIAGTFAMTLTVNEVHDIPCTTSLSILRQVVVLSGAGKIAGR
ncbi:MAG: hypothetical protein ACRDOA_02405 [Streptosporangiaceae bacterium]